jgi:drug/metabolite transporter (DMT)-like permease
MKARNWLLFTVMATFSGLNWSITKTGLGFVSPTMFVQQRFAFFGIIFSPLLFFQRKKIPRDKDTLVKIVILSMVNTSQIIATNIALAVLSSGTGAVLNFTEPIFVFCIAMLFLKEETNVIKFVGTVVGFAGVSVLFAHSISSPTLPSGVIMVFGAFLWAVTIVFYKKFLSHVDAFVASYFQYSLGALPLTLFALARNDFAVCSDATYLWILIYESISISAIGSTVWLYLIKKEGATVVAGSSLIIPVLALFFGWALLKENIYIESVLGSALILAGVGLVNARSRRSSGTIALSE